MTEYATRDDLLLLQSRLKRLISSGSGSGGGIPAGSVLAYINGSPLYYGGSMTISGGGDGYITGIRFMGDPNVYVPSDDSGRVTLPAYPTTLPASDVASWAKQSKKPTYSWTEITGRPSKLSQFVDDLGDSPVHTHEQYALLNGSSLRDFFVRDLFACNVRIYFGSSQSSPYLEYDTVNNAFHFSTDVYSSGTVTAGGVGSGGSEDPGSGAGYLYELGDVTRYGTSVGRSSGAAQAGDLLSYDGSRWRALAQSQIVPDLTGYALRGELSGKADWGATLDHYGIADAYISGNTIHLGSKSLTVSQWTEQYRGTVTRIIAGNINYNPDSNGYVNINDAFDPYVLKTAIADMATKSWVAGQLASYWTGSQVQQQLAPYWTGAQVAQNIALALEDYVLSEDLDSVVASLATKSDLDRYETIIHLESNYYTSSEIDEMLEDLGSYADVHGSYFEYFCAKELRIGSGNRVYFNSGTGVYLEYIPSLDMFHINKGLYSDGAITAGGVG